MAPNSKAPETDDLDDLTRLLHLGLTVLGLLAYVTGLWAGDYKRAHHPGFSLHKWLGLSLSFVVLWRVWYGFYGPREIQFRQWVPFSWDRIRPALEDLFNLLRLKLPDRPVHQGLAAVVQTFGLGLFSWMAATGTLMFFFLEPGRKAGWVMHGVKELHEVGEWLIPVFLAIHVGAVTLHALAGNPLWRRAFFLEDKR